MKEERRTHVLTIVSGPQQGQRFPLSGRGQVVVGRESTADLAIVDPMMSRRHFEIAPQGGRLQIRDLGSRNGTKVNDRTITAATVAESDVVSAGLTAFRIDVEEAAPEGPHKRETPAVGEPHDIENQRTWQVPEGEPPPF